VRFLFVCFVCGERVSRVVGVRGLESRSRSGLGGLGLNFNPTNQPDRRRSGQSGKAPSRAVYAVQNTYVFGSGQRRAGEKISTSI